MASYRFVDTRDAKRTVTLTEIDSEMRKEFGLPEDSERYSWMYDTAVNLGMGQLMKDGGSHTTVDHVWAQVERYPEFACYLDISLKYLGGMPYYLDAWR